MVSDCEHFSKGRGADRLCLWGSPWHDSGMKITMDGSGRIVIPKALRERACLMPGQPLKIEVRNGTITIEPEPLTLALEQKGSFLVACPSEKVEPLSNEDVLQAIKSIRDR